MNLDSKSINTSDIEEMETVPRMEWEDTSRFGSMINGEKVKGNRKILNHGSWIMISMTCDPILY